MKKIFILCMLSLLIFSCNNHDDIDNTPKPSIEIGKGSTITFGIESFGSDSVPTRATSAANNKSFEVDLGDGTMADISVQKEGKKADTPKTRASLTNGMHLNIYAVKGGVRVGGMLQGTVSVTTDPATWTEVTDFIPDAGSKLVLEPGTYTFVCYDDNVVDDGTNLIVKAGMTDALIGTTTQTISGDQYSIHFEMKHQTARVRLYMRSYVGDGGDPSAYYKSPTENITSTTATNLEHKFNYNFNQTTYTATTGILSLNVSGYEDWRYSYLTVSDIASHYVQKGAADFFYLLPGTRGQDLKMTYTGGTLYRKNLVGLSTALNSIGTVNRADSYIVTITIRPTYTYLFNDGTTGKLKDKGSRIPVGIVVTEKSGSTPGLAAALNVISGKKWTTLYNSNNNTTNFATHSAAFNDMNGYNYTYSAATSADGVVKATSSNYPAFQAAASYNPGVPTASSIGKWFLPSLGQIHLLMDKIGFQRRGSSDAMLHLATVSLAYAFQAAGGSLGSSQFKYNIPSNSNFVNLWSSTSKSPSQYWRYWCNTVNGFYDTSSSLTYETVLPFVYF